MPRPRFTLRVVLVVTAIVSVVVWQYSIVLRRREAMDSDHTFIVAILRQLNVAGIVVSDPRGLAGYALSRSAAKVTLLEILEAVESPFNQPMPSEFAEGTARAVEAAVSSGVNEMRRRLAAVTLANLPAAKAA